MKGFPGRCFKPCATAKPVVATAVSGTPEAVQSGITGYLHPAHDTEGLSESLFKILSNPRMAIQMGRAGKASLKGTFLIPKMLEAIEEIYEKCIV